MLYGVQGIGKSTFGAMAPKPVFIPTEDGLNDIECDRFPLAKTVEEMMGALATLYTESHEYQTVVIDSLDWLEQVFWSKVCAEKAVKSIEEIGYGKGYLFALNLWRDFLTGLQALRDEKGMMVILIAHSTIQRFESPESTGYDRYTPRLHKTAASIVQEWVDEVLFATYKVYTKEQEKGFGQKSTKGIGSGERIIRTEERPAFVAKNRLNLPLEIPLNYQEYAKYLPNGKEAHHG